MIHNQKIYFLHLSKLAKLNCSTQTKKELVAGFMDELKFRLSTQLPQDSKRIKTMTTQEETINSESSVEILQAISDLQKKIILKRDMKIELHEEIEQVEEELEAIERTVYVKQQMDDEIKREIDKRMIMIEMGDYEFRQREKNMGKYSQNMMSKIFYLTFLTFPVLESLAEQMNPEGQRQFQSHTNCLTDVQEYNPLKSYPKWALFENEQVKGQLRGKELILDMFQRSK